MKNDDKRLTVVAGFDRGGIRPMFFKRPGEKEFKKVKRVNFVFSQKEGRKKLTVFEVETDGDTAYEIAYNQESVLWSLRQVFLPESV